MSQPLSLRRAGTESSRSCTTHVLTGVMLLAAVLAFGTRNAGAQQTAVCSEMPGTGERIECTQDATSSDEIRLNLKGWVSF